MERRETRTACVGGQFSFHFFSFLTAQNQVKPTGLLHTIYGFEKHPQLLPCLRDEPSSQHEHNAEKKNFLRKTTFVILMSSLCLECQAQFQQCKKDSSGCGWRGVRGLCSSCLPTGQVLAPPVTGLSTPPRKESSLESYAQGTQGSPSYSPRPPPQATGTSVMDVGRVAHFPGIYLGSAGLRTGFSMCQRNRSFNTMRWKRAKLNGQKVQEGLDQVQEGPLTFWAR